MRSVDSASIVYQNFATHTRYFQAPSAKKEVETIAVTIIQEPQNAARSSFSKYAVMSSSSDAIFEFESEKETLELTESTERTEHASLYLYADQMNEVAASEMAFSFCFCFDAKGLISLEAILNNNYYY